MRSILVSNYRSSLVTDGGIAAMIVSTSKLSMTLVQAARIRRKFVGARHSLHLLSVSVEVRFVLTVQTPPLRSWPTKPISRIC